jgi:hypothetical protein
MQVTLATWHLQQLVFKKTSRGDTLKHVVHFAAHHDAAFVIEEGMNGDRLQKDAIAAICQTAQAEYRATIEGAVFDLAKPGNGEALLFCFVRSRRASASDLSYEVHLQKLFLLNGGATWPVIASLGIWDKSRSKVHEVKFGVRCGFASGSDLPDVAAALQKQQVILAGEPSRNYSHYEVVGFETGGHGQSITTINV